MSSPRMVPGNKARSMRVRRLKVIFCRGNEKISQRSKETSADRNQLMIEGLSTKRRNVESTVTQTLTSCYCKHTNKVQ